MQEEEEEQQEARARKESEECGRKTGRICECSFFVLEVEIIITPPLWTFWLQRVSEWVERRGQKRKNFRSSLFASVPCVDVDEELTPK